MTADHVLNDLLAEEVRLRTTASSSSTFEAIVIEQRLKHFRGAEVESEAVSITRHVFPVIPSLQAERFDRRQCAAFTQIGSWAG